MQSIQANPTSPALTAVPIPQKPTAKTRPTPPVAPSRAGKRSVSGHFAPDVSRQLRILAAETDRTVQDLLEEALNDLFRKHDKSAIC